MDDFFTHFELYCGFLPLIKLFSRCPGIYRDALSRYKKLREESWDARSRPA